MHPLSNQAPSPWPSADEPRGQPPALLASWGPTRTSTSAHHAPRTRRQSQARPRIGLLLLLEHHGGAMSSRRPWARVRRQFRPRARRYCRTFLFWRKVRKTPCLRPPRGTVIAMQHHVDHWGSNKGKRALRAVTLESDRHTLRDGMCTTTNAPRRRKSLRLFVQGPSAYALTRGLDSERGARKCCKNEAKCPKSPHPLPAMDRHRNNVQMFCVSSAIKTVNWSISWAHFSLLRENGDNTAEYESSAMWKICEIRQRTSRS